MFRKAFDTIVKPADGQATDSLYKLFLVAFYGTITILLATIIAVIFFDNPGQFGDLFGGVLNPLLTFLTFMGLLITIVLQQYELMATRKELARAAEAQEDQKKLLDKQVRASEIQQFESTFFQMLSLHNTIVNSIDIDRGPSKSKLLGRESFRYFKDFFTNEFKNPIGFGDKETINMAHDALWKRFQNDLAHYYRFLYNIIRFIDESDFEKKKYIRFVRSQLSDFELFILFYNGLTDKAHKFKLYIEKYALFDNLPKEILISPSHSDYYAPSAFEGAS